MAYPQRESVIAQEPLIGIKISRIKDFVGGVMKGAGKAGIISERIDVFGCNPKLQLNLRRPADHHE
jgi:hypothetical protein